MQIFHVNFSKVINVVCIILFSANYIKNDNKFSYITVATNRNVLAVGLFCSHRRYFFAKICEKSGWRGIKILCARTFRLRPLLLAANSLFIWSAFPAAIVFVVVNLTVEKVKNITFLEIESRVVVRRVKDNFYGGVLM